MGVWGCIQKVAKRSGSPWEGPRGEVAAHSLPPPSPITGFLAPTSMFTFVVLVITIVICLCHVCFGHFKYLSAHNYKVWGEGVWGRPRAEAPGRAGGWLGAEGRGSGCRKGVGSRWWLRGRTPLQSLTHPGPSRLSTQRQIPRTPEAMAVPPLLPLSPNLR